MKKNYLLTISTILVLFVITLAYTQPSVRYSMINDELHEATHVRLPGYIYSGSPEHIIELKDWAGSSLLGLTVEVDGERNPELEAEPALRAIGWATPDHVLELGADGHYILRKPEQTFRTFSLYAWHRITPWKLTEK